MIVLVLVKPHMCEIEKSYMSAIILAICECFINESSLTEKNTHRSRTMDISKILKALTEYFDENNETTARDNLSEREKAVEANVRQILIEYQNENIIIENELVQCKFFSHCFVNLVQLF